MESVQVEVSLTPEDRRLGNQRYAAVLFGDMQRIASGQASMLIALVCFALSALALVFVWRQTVGDALATAVIVALVVVLIQWTFAMLFQTLWSRATRRKFREVYAEPDATKITIDAEGVQTTAAGAESHTHWSHVGGLYCFDGQLLIDLGACALIIPDRVYENQAQQDQVIGIAKRAGVAVS